jgi:hypothetical protein
MFYKRGALGYSYASQPALVRRHRNDIVLCEKYGIYGDKQTLTKPGLGQGSGPGQRLSSSYFYVTVTVIDMGFVDLTVTEIS